MCLANITDEVGFYQRVNMQSDVVKLRHLYVLCIGLCSLRIFSKNVDIFSTIREFS